MIANACPPPYKERLKFIYRDARLSTGSSVDHWETVRCRNLIERMRILPSAPPLAPHLDHFSSGIDGRDPAGVQDLGIQCVYDKVAHHCRTGHWRISVFNDRSCRAVVYPRFARIEAFPMRV